MHVTSHAVLQHSGLSAQTASWQLCSSHPTWPGAVPKQSLGVNVPAVQVPSNVHVVPSPV